ncbi:MAG: hypothetical protein Q8Q89_03925 [bacterium]|nr:hypothetical protein [bacterium]
MRLSIKQYINETIRREAEIGYDKSVKRWYGILHHRTGDIYSQRKTKLAVSKEMAEILEDFIALSLMEDKKVAHHSEIKNPKIQGAYR